MQQHSFGHWLKLRRKALDLTQAGLADQVGCSSAAIRKIEAEERRPSAQIAERLAEIFNIPQSEQKDFLRFARGDLRFIPTDARENVPWRESKSHSSNLPATFTSLIGRDAEIIDVHEYLMKDDIRLVTLMGPPGIGKTRLSIESARSSLSDFLDGVFFVALAPLDDSTFIAPTVAQSLGYVGATNISTDEQLKEGIGDKHMLLVLDNCEHLIEDVAAFVAGLLLACPYLKILATSRESLRISGEWLYAVPAFDIPKETSSIDMESASKFPALTLFAERAHAVRSDFILNDDNIQTVAKVCAHLDGLPLAIELIAARVRLMSPESLLARLNDQLILSTDGMRAASARQKTLNNAIGWSYNLLSGEEQKLFVRLSIFSGGFTLEAAEVIFSPTVTKKSVSDLIVLLLDKSLLQRIQEESSGPRYTMLTTIQQFARDRLLRMDEEAEIRNRHLAYFLDLAEQADKEIRGPNQVQWLHRLDDVRDNLRSALEWAMQTRQTEAALQMASNLSLFWFRRSNLSEGRQWLGRVVSLLEAPQYSRLYSYALAQLAFHTWLQIGPKDARPSAEQALSVARAHDDKWNTAWALTVLGLVLIHEGNFMAAQSTLQESKAFFREVHDEWGYANAVISLALGLYIQDDRATSLALHEEALALFRNLGDRYFEGVALRHIGDLQVKHGNLARAKAALREALILAQQLDSKYEISACLWSLGYVIQGEGNVVRAVHLYGLAKNVLDSIGAWNEREASQFEIDIAPCRAVLSETEFATAMEQGRAMTMEQAIMYALEDRND